MTSSKTRLSSYGSINQSIFPFRYYMPSCASTRLRGRRRMHGPRRDGRRIDGHLERRIDGPVHVVQPRHASDPLTACQTHTHTHTHTARVSKRATCLGLALAEDETLSELEILGVLLVTEPHKRPGRGSVHSHLYQCLNPLWLLRVHLHDNAPCTLYLHLYLQLLPPPSGSIYL